jgi:hypothetical protein
MSQPGDIKSTAADVLTEMVKKVSVEGMIAGVGVLGTICTGGALPVVTSVAGIVAAMALFGALKLKKAAKDRAKDEEQAQALRARRTVARTTEARPVRRTRSTRRDRAPAIVVQGRDRQRPSNLQRGLRAGVFRLQTRTHGPTDRSEGPTHRTQGRHDADPVDPRRTDAPGVRHQLARPRGRVGSSRPWAEARRQHRPPPRPREEARHQHRSPQPDPLPPQAPPLARRDRARNPAASRTGDRGQAPARAIIPPASKTCKLRPNASPTSPSPRSTPRASPSVPRKSVGRPRSWKGSRNRPRPTNPPPATTSTPRSKSGARSPNGPTSSARSTPRPNPSEKSSPSALTTSAPPTALAM